MMVEKLEGSLWAAADNLRANSKLTSSEYCMPVLGVINHFGSIRVSQRYLGAFRSFSWVT